MGSSSFSSIIDLVERQLGRQVSRSSSEVISSRMTLHPTKPLVVKTVPNPKHPLHTPSDMLATMSTSGSDLSVRDCSPGASDAELKEDARFKEDAEKQSPSSSKSRVSKRTLMLKAVNQEVRVRNGRNQ
ncbi:uncharacterized protein LOC113301983 [Papaver somniferum]|uniref:uncharacterized protein LOC113301983 n=1 Tax=Papaver somniferum TaxID=3469 RepID=UPI000E6F8CF5|nr:uncharacterized protein LOC113301983 [Papaver somniferum]